VRAAPDGYTFMLGSIVQYMLPFFQKNVPFDPLKDFTPISIVAVVPNVLAVTAGLPIHSVKDLIEYAKKPGVKLHYGTTGTGSTHHLGGILLAQTAGIPLEHVPYKGGNPAMQDALSGAIPFVILTATTIMPQVKNGKLRALGLIENRRFSSVPGVPTIGETVPGYAVPDTWFGFLGPAGLPRPIVERLHGEVSKLLQLKETAEQLQADGVAPAGGTPEEFHSVITKEIEIWRRVVNEAGVKLE